MTVRRFSTFRIGSNENRCGNGDGGKGGNGLQLFEILVKYQLTKSLAFDGNVSVIRSAAKRADLDGTGFVKAAGDKKGDVIKAATYVSAKDIGTEIDLSLKYSIYKGFFTRLTFAYLFAGDYGLKVGERNFDDTWALYSEMRYTF